MPGQRGPVPVQAKDADRDITKEILELLETKSSYVLADEFPGIPQIELKSALDRAAGRNMVTFQQSASDVVVLEKEGQEICDAGSHEFLVWQAVKNAGKIPIKDLTAAVGPSAKFGQGTAMKNKWVKKEGDSLVVAAKDVEDKTRLALQDVRDTRSIKDTKVLADFKKRKLVRVEKALAYTVEKGPKWAKEVPLEVTDLTSEMLASGVCALLHDEASTNIKSGLGVGKLQAIQLQSLGC